MRILVAGIIACGLAAVAGGADAKPSVVGGVLFVNDSSDLVPGDRVTVKVISGPAARLTLALPSGYRTKLDARAGVRIGDLSAFVAPLGGGPGSAFQVDLLAADPARYVSDPTAQACAPGTHEAVWLAKARASGRSLELPIFVDREGEGSTPRTVLRLCPAWPTPAGGLVARYLDFFALERVLGTLTTRGRNEWSALVSPPLANLAPDEARAFELRAYEPIPQRLTLRARHHARTRTVTLTGRVTALGQPRARAGVEVLVLSGARGGDVPILTARTDASGRFSLKRRIVRTTRFYARVPAEGRPCTTPSSAPGGCLSESVSVPAAAVATVRVRTT